MRGDHFSSMGTNNHQEQCFPNHRHSQTPVIILATPKAFIQSLTLYISSNQLSLLCVRAKSLQSCPTLATPWTPWSLPGSSVHRIHQVRILEWVAISFSRGSSRTHTLKWMDLIPAGSLVQSSALPISQGPSCVSLMWPSAHVPFPGVDLWIRPKVGRLGPQDIQSSSAISSLLLNPRVHVSFCRYRKQAQAWEENGSFLLDRGCFHSTSSYFIWNHFKTIQYTNLKEKRSPTNWPQIAITMILCGLIIH